MIILGVDYGDVRTGVAVCDSGEVLASPVCVIRQDYQPKLIAQIVSLILEKQAKKVVVGNPVNMDGSSGARSQACVAFAKALSEAADVPVELWDERMTTVSAHRALNETNTRGKQRKAVVDAVAAAVILQSYIDRK